MLPPSSCSEVCVVGRLGSRALSRAIDGRLWGASGGRSSRAAFGPSQTPWGHHGPGPGVVAPTPRHQAAKRLRSDPESGERMTALSPRRASAMARSVASAPPDTQHAHTPLGAPPWCVESSLWPPPPQPLRALARTAARLARKGSPRRPPGAEARERIPEPHRRRPSPLPKRCSRPPPSPAYRRPAA